MRRTDFLAAAMALTGLALTIPGTASAASGAQSGGSGSGGSAANCVVRVNREAAAGVFGVTRQTLENGRCVCSVSTGPKSQGGSAESALAALLERRSCADAPYGGTIAESGLGTGTWVVFGVAGAAGLAAALASGGSSSP